MIQKERDLNRVLEAKVAERTRRARSGPTSPCNIIDTIGAGAPRALARRLHQFGKPAASGRLGYSEPQLVGMSIGDVLEADQEQAGAFVGRGSRRSSGRAR